MGTIKDYHDLRVYQLAFESAMQIFELTKVFPREETYSLTDQIRRSSRSVCANITEAWRKRRYPASFIAAETLVWLYFALHCGYLNKQKHTELTEHYNHICAQLTTMMNDPDSWCKTVERRPKSVERL